MSNYENHPVAKSTMPALVLAGYATVEAARADNVVFACAECGSLYFATPTAESSREDQQHALITHYAMECCDPAAFHLV